MNSWLLLRRLRGPAFLILVGITALLNQWGILGFGRSWPLYLILAGIFGLVERAMLTASPAPPSVYPAAYPVSNYPQSSWNPVGSPTGTTQNPSQNQPGDRSTDTYTDPDNRRS